LLGVEGLLCAPAGAGGRCLCLPPPPRVGRLPSTYRPALSQSPRYIPLPPLPTLLQQFGGRTLRIRTRLSRPTHFPRACALPHTLTHFCSLRLHYPHTPPLLSLPAAVSIHLPLPHALFGNRLLASWRAACSLLHLQNTRRSSRARRCHLGRYTSSSLAADW